MTTKTTASYVNPSFVTLGIFDEFATSQPTKNEGYTSMTKNDKIGLILPLLTLGSI